METLGSFAVQAQTTKLQPEVLAPQAAGAPTASHDGQPSTPAGTDAPQQPGQVGGSGGGSEPNEVSMGAGKRKPEDCEDEEDEEARAAAGLLGEELPDKQKDKKVKFDDTDNSQKQPSFCPTLAQTIKDTEAINNLVGENQRAPGDPAASADSGHPRG